MDVEWKWSANSRQKILKNPWKLIVMWYKKLMV
jgi:hypothetical protein